MSTNYVTKWGNRDVTRERVLGAFPDAFVSEEDEEDGQTTLTAEDVGIRTPDGTCWPYFGRDGLLTGINVYCDSVNAAAADAVAAVLGIEIVSEHDDGYDYHSFPVDVRAAKPAYELNGWQLFEFEGWVYPYHAPSDGFYQHLETQDCKDALAMEEYVRTVLDAEVASETTAGAS